MNAEEFKKILLDSLNNLTTTEIKRIRSKYNAEGDYGVNEDGSSYWIPPKAAFNVKFQEGFSDIDLISTFPFGGSVSGALSSGRAFSMNPPILSAAARCICAVTWA